MDWIREIEVIGWDLDGTLYPSSVELSREIERLKMEELGGKFNGDLEKGKLEYSKNLKKLGSHTEALKALGIDGEGFFVRIWDEIDLGEYIKADKKIVELFDGLEDKRHFLLSNSNSREQIMRKLGLVGLSPGVFETIVSSVDAGASKPHPKPFELVLELMGVDEKDKCKVMYVGDRVSTDIKGAKSVGIKACLVGGESALADICVKAVYDVAEIFD